MLISKDTEDLIIQPFEKMLEKVFFILFKL